MATLQNFLSSSLTCSLPRKMAASTFLLFNSSLIRARKPLLLSVSSKPFPTLSRRYTSSAAPLDTLNSDSAADEPLDSAPQSHPWPEWVTFIDRLKSKGYFVEANNSAASDAANDYKDMNFVKDACISFARDRFDLFKSLSTDDIETVVGSGCPNLLRKSVNSAKRLRVHVQIDEGDVCSTCNVRGSCDRAYVTLKESEAAARTVDIVRILLSYALDPLAISEGEKPPGRERIDASARNLLSDLTKLSDTSCNAELPKSSAKAPTRKKNTLSGNDDEEFTNVEMKRGDWMCPKCNFLNFSRNLHCLKCKEDGPKNVRGDEIEMKKGDWICSECNFMNFSRNKRCLRCKADGPNKVETDVVQMKKGDWNCPECGFMNFSSNRKCLRCQEARPKRQLNPGEWECPTCDFVNFRRNQVCLKCKHERPGEPANEHDEHTWRPQRSN
ncbi:Zinc finger (Ran-binding) family protein, putative isoform 2 [Hibiscus syriacus]|uniref:Zinc finger (Ran-binding) family protein, putative isoform 2 n=1 Tax=Hibiscus syriacus TaxID=106335 RepID=A0A6A3C6T6_HIBSY|nr:zinc finger protein VAR3, chloroplastic [Hibiscus syriacus]KAE8723591.1 Zinc finger (Ran-binding) family protein, putative isoform 2 [Hibiscus syriacus]